MSKDLFSLQSISYARYRPTYPAELFEYIMGFVQETDRAWDCGTGNGQAALVLTRYFEKVNASDISEKQLAIAPQHTNIEYTVCAAEHSPFPGSTFDLITAAQAYHWFNFPAFEKEVYRVSKPGGIIAVWGYNFITTDNKLIDGAVKKFYTNIIGPYWDAERKYVEENYADIPFGFPFVAEKPFSINGQWSLHDMVGYLNSWSAVQHFIAANNYNPVEDISAELAAYWKEDSLQSVSFPIFLKLGRIIK